MALADYKIGDRLTEFLAVRRLQRKEYDGRQFLSLNLGDKSASIDAVMWEGFAEIVDRIRPGVVLRIQGFISEYRGRPQIKLERIRLAQAQEYDLADFLPASSVPSEELAGRLDEIIGSLADPDLRRLLENIYDREDIREGFLGAPGGQRWHHAFVGGLAEHTFAVVALCNFCAGLYPELDGELLICGALLHDLGKIKQYATSSVFEYTDSGRLLGHIVEGDELVADAVRHIGDFPREKAMRLRHLILAHHGELENGSPVVPQTREAFVLAYADKMDSMMGALGRIAEKTGEGPWSEWVNLISRFIYFGRGESPPAGGTLTGDETAAGGEE